MATIVASSTSPHLIPIINRDKFKFRSIKIKTLLKSQELWDLVKNGSAEETIAQRVWENK